MKTGGKKFLAAVDAEVVRRSQSTPVGIRTLTICFSARTVQIDDRKIGPVEFDCLAIPLLTTERVVLTGQRGPVI